MNAITITYRNKLDLAKRRVLRSTNTSREGGKPHADLNAFRTQKRYIME